MTKVGLLVRMSKSFVVRALDCEKTRIGGMLDTLAQL